MPGEVRFSREGEILSCAWHGWEYDIRTGQSWCEPERLRVRSYDVTVEPGSALVAEPETEPAVPGRVKGPYVAETYPVEVDGQYVVVVVNT